MGRVEVAARSLGLLGLCGALAACNPGVVPGACSGEDTIGVLDKLVIQKFKNDLTFPALHDSSAQARLDMISTTGESGNVRYCAANFVISPSGRSAGSTYRLTYRVTLSDDRKSIYVEADVGRMTKFD